ncbi:ClpXP protease specificity-enhancing factor [Rhodoferax sp.]|uniref:ClpXP protease specificity-enhancing factor n=1 Tax=Rhodoferax sp. TaxID=50421 RepID=UPI002614CB1B|nr:ClpXP protease specificity-enhancing factor [Rhodoferax sp.]MDD2809543.1 ClpXP protease specificity-enhancing factor [Rhodoferax sp.]
MKSEAQTTSTRPYLIRALHEWCVDNGLTPYVTVWVDNTVQVPREFVKDGEIVLNASFDATMGLKLGNEFIEFKARFGGVVREIFIPIDHVAAIFARENGQGMAFPRVESLVRAQAAVTSESVPKPASVQLAAVEPASTAAESVSATTSEASKTKPSAKRPALTRIK